MILMLCLIHAPAHRVVFDFRLSVVDAQRNLLQFPASGALIEMNFPLKLRPRHHVASARLLRSPNEPVHLAVQRRDRSQRTFKVAPREDRAA